MLKLLWLLRGGVLKGYRSQVLGVATGLGGIVKALAYWAVGDHPLIALIQAIGGNWALIAGCFGLATVAAKIERTSTKACRRSPARRFAAIDRTSGHPSSIDTRKENDMNSLTWLVTGGFAKGYRTQISAWSRCYRRWRAGRSAI